MSDGKHLAKAFARTVFVRTLDAERRWLRKNNRTAELDELLLLHLRDTSIEGDPELQLLIQQYPRIDKEPRNPRRFRRTRL